MHSWVVFNNLNRLLLFAELKFYIDLLILKYASYLFNFLFVFIKQDCCKSKIKYSALDLPSYFQKRPFFYFYYGS